jgi:predicted GIY-YIG superfamily endonuclease
MTCGIYCLYFETDDFQYYIGQSIDVEKRYKAHCRGIIRGDHRNKSLINEYTRTNTLPSFSLIEKVSSFSELDSREIYWISEYNSYIEGFNNTLGGSSNGYGQYSSTSLYTNEQYIAIMNKLAYTDDKMQIIADTLSVTLNVVRNISCGSSCRFLEEVDPITYAILLEKNGTRVRKYETLVYLRILEKLASTTDSFETIAEELSVTVKVVEGIAWGNRHQHLGNEYPELYSIVMAKIGTRTYKIYPKLVSPSGEIIEVIWAKDICDKYKLSPSHVSQVLSGKRRVHLGWTRYNG